MKADTLLDIKQKVVLILGLKASIWDILHNYRKL